MSPSRRAMPSPARETNTWFHSDQGRRYGRDIALIVALKIVLLTALYFFFVAPQPRADAGADATRRHLLDGTNQPKAADAHDRP
ncbi:MAG TPA: hypothetical protein VF132_07700 [Rudaea sp.]